MTMLDVRVEPKLMTADEYVNRSDDGRWVELINGEIVEMPPSSPRNTVLAGWILYLLAGFIIPRKLGYLSMADGGYRVSPTSVMQPDVGFITRARAGGLSGKVFPVAPDLAIEVISPSERVGKINEKLHAYLDGGTPYVWLVYPESRSVEIYTAVGQYTTIEESDTIDGGDLLPEFTVTGKELFSVLDVEDN